jgi:excinuclease ABC subunit C
MRAAAEAERFEEAAQLRDAMRTVQTLRDRQQKVATPELGDRDVFGMKVGPSGAAIQVFAMRAGRVVERIELVTDPGAVAGGETDVLQAAVMQFYDGRVPPGEIHLPAAIDDQDAAEALLSERASRRVRILVPQRGDKRALVDLAIRNAELSYRTRFNEITAAHFDALETLRSELGLPGLPRRIECFDISTIQGRETVAAMVVCEDGRMKRSEYRRFRIKGVGSHLKRTVPRELDSPDKPDAAALSSLNDSRPPFSDDFAAMREVVGRRYRKVLEAGGPFPDLLVIDGGKGQLSAAYEALEAIGLGNLVAVGLAKKEELLVMRDRPDPVVLAEHDPALLLLQRVRDEAHRFAVTFHRRARTIRDLRSALDEVPGVGLRRRKALLTTFGSLAGVRRATREELAAVVGARAAAAVIEYFERVR